jgi:hypothetical protein
LPASSEVFSLEPSAPIAAVAARRASMILIGACHPSGSASASLKASVAAISGS